MLVSSSKLPRIPHTDWYRDSYIEAQRHIRCELNLDPCGKGKNLRRLSGQEASQQCARQGRFRIY